MSFQDSKHLKYLQHALSLAKQCTSTPTAFCVGALIVDDPTGTILATGFSRELPGNTHAEEVCIHKILTTQQRYGSSSQKDTANIAPPATAAPHEPEAAYSLYTSMEPCSQRLSGNTPCAHRILAYNSDPERQKRGLGRINTVYVGVKEPNTFIQKNVGEDMLLAGGVGYIHIPGLEKEILDVAKKGHSE